MPRLFVIPARDTEVAVILRRGPSRWYHLILWDTRHDNFQHGAWFKGRIYEEKCDLSPDGQLFVYFVHQGSRGGTEFTHAYTALSRPPWLYALMLWPQGTTYGGGGRFFGNRQLCLRGVWHDSKRSLHPDYVLRGIELVEAQAELHKPSAEVSDADWCGHDHQGHLIYTRDGSLFRQSGKRDDIVADFTDLRPNPQAAPEWARRAFN
jgi:hypothetical protein